MKYFTLTLLLILLISCNTSQQEIKENSELIIGERIDGPANIRDKPNGDVLLELNDNVLIDVSEIENGWCKVIVRPELEQDEFKDFDEITITKNRPIIQNGETIGKMKRNYTTRTSKGNGGRTVFAELIGYTHKDNIKPHTIIERSFEKEIKEKGRDLSELDDFIKKFDLDDRDLAIKENVKTFENTENSAHGGPSPGPRMILFFEDELLIGFFHSRDTQIESTKTHKLIRYGSATFFKDYPKKKQDDFVKELNVWVNSFD